MTEHGQQHDLTFLLGEAMKAYEASRTEESRQNAENLYFFASEEGLIDPDEAPNIEQSLGIGPDAVEEHLLAVALS